MKKRVLLLTFVWMLAACVPAKAPAPTRTATLLPTPLPTALPPLAMTSTPTLIPTPELVRALPAVCGTPGVAGYQAPALPDSVTAPIVLEKGKVLVVTNNSDEINGDVSSRAALVNNPGADGISLREALMVTRNDPSDYTIRFDPKLKGMTIQVGSWDHTTLPVWDNSAVIVNGDVDGDGQPDITLENDVAEPSIGFAIRPFQIHSSGNTLYALKVVGFSNAVIFDAPSTNQVYENNTVSNVEMDVFDGGIGLDSGKYNWPQPNPVTNNTWEGLKITGNTIRSRMGISIGLTTSSGDRLEDLVILGNTISVAPLKDEETMGIALSAGTWLNQGGNTIRNAWIVNNTIEGASTFLFYIGAGLIGSSGNLVENVWVQGNQIKATQPVRANGVPYDTVLIATGDGASTYSQPNFRPITYPENNIIRNVWFTGNVVEGFGGSGVTVTAGCCGARHNTVEDILLLGNVVNGVFAGSGLSNNGIYIIGSGSGLGDGQDSADNTISRLTIQNNSIQQDNIRAFFTGQEFFSGGINLVGGAQSESNGLQDVWIVANKVDSPVVGINLVGGWSQTDGFISKNNTISGARLWCNQINGDLGMLTAVFPEVKGINLAGGYGVAQGNQVTGVEVLMNDVLGKKDDMSVYQDTGTGGQGNGVELKTP